MTTFDLDTLIGDTEAEIRRVIDMAGTISKAITAIPKDELNKAKQT